MPMTTIKDQILEIIKTKPKHYTWAIKKDPILMKWIDDNTLVNDKTLSLPIKIFSAINQESNICKYNNIKTLSRFNEGWVCCDIAANCKCTSENISASVSSTKSKVTEADQETTNLKRAKTMKKLFGVEYSFQRPTVKLKLSKPKIEPEVFDKLNDFVWLNTEYNVKLRTLVDIADELKVYYGTVGEYCREHGFTIRQVTNYSLEEMKVSRILDDLGITHNRNNWDILNKGEIDLYVDSKKLGIEVNGLFWHSFNPNCTKCKNVEDKDRHIRKTIDANMQGVDLIHFTDVEINYKIDIVKSTLQSRLGLSEKIYARKCRLEVINKDIENEFLDKNHFQGYIPSKKCYGLYHEDILVMVMSFGKPRYNKDSDLELLRLASLNGYCILGGVEKIFKQVKYDYIGNKIVSYCDVSKFTGAVYEKLGFINSDKKLIPSYFWTNGNIIINRSKTTHSAMAKWLKGYDSSKSQTVNMFDAKYRRFYDCGQQTWFIQL